MFLPAVVYSNIGRNILLSPLISLETFLAAVSSNIGRNILLSPLISVETF
jgi:hypothetical protein